MKKMLGAAIVAALLTPLAAQADPLPVSAFAYDAQAPFGYVDGAVTHHGAANARILRYMSLGGRRLTAEIISPAHATKPGPGVLFVHWLGDPKTTNHTEFEPDAYALAAKGVTSVLVDAMWSAQQYGKRDWFTQVRSPETDYANSIAQVIELRRALDILIRQPNVDAERIAYVGHDFGAMYGSVLSGVDPRPKWYVLMAGNPSFSQWFLLGNKPADVEAFKTQIAPLDPPGYLARSTARAFLFQYALKDEYITPENEAAFFASAPPPRAMFVYKVDHSLATPQALIDRLDWLETRIF